jgi:hypothetical protein
MLARCCGCSPLKSYRFSCSGLARATCEMGHNLHDYDCPVRVKLRRTQCEHMFSGLPQIADIFRASRHVSNVPNLPLALQKRSRWRFACNDQETVRPFNRSGRLIA